MTVTTTMLREAFREAQGAWARGELVMPGICPDGGSWMAAVARCRSGLVTIDVEHDGPVLRYYGPVVDDGEKEEAA